MLPAIRLLWRNDYVETQCVVFEEGSGRRGIFQPQGRRAGDRQNNGPASPKQLSYLLDLARQRGITPQQIAARFQVPDIQHLTRQQCSDQIDEWRAA